MDGHTAETDILHVFAVKHNVIHNSVGYNAIDKYGVLQTTQTTSDGAVTFDSSCCANCVEPFRLQKWGPDLAFLGMWTRWMAGAAAHKSG